MVNSVIAVIFAALSIRSINALDTCRSATKEDFDALPGASKFFDSVTADFGGRASTGHTVNGGPDTPIANTVRPSDSSSDRKAAACMSGGPFQAEAQPGAISCSSQLTDFGGTFNGGSGEITSELQSGHSVATQWSTSKETTVGTGIETSVSVKMPVFADISGSVQTTFSVTNTQSKSTTSTIDQVQTFSATATVEAGNTCRMVINITTCNVNVQLQVPVTFSGFVNVHFDRDVTFSGAAPDNKHSDWWISPSIYGMNVSDISSNMTLSGSLQSTSYGDAFVSCTGTDGTTTTSALAENAKSAPSSTASGAATKTSGSSLSAGVAGLAAPSLGALLVALGAWVTL